MSYYQKNVCRCSAKLFVDFVLFVVDIKSAVQDGMVAGEVSFGDIDCVVADEAFTVDAIVVLLVVLVLQLANDLAAIYSMKQFTVV